MHDSQSSDPYLKGHGTHGLRSSGSLRDRLLLNTTSGRARDLNQSLVRTLKLPYARSDVSLTQRLLPVHGPNNPQVYL